MDIERLRKAFPTMVRLKNTARGALRRLQPHRIDRDTATHMDGLADGNEAIYRLLKVPAEHARMTRDIHREMTTARRRAAGVALNRLRAAAEHVQEWREWVARTRRDVRLSFERALVGVDRNGVILLGLAREQIKTRLASSSVRELLDTYQAAQPRQDDPIAYLEAEIIEGLLERGKVHPSTEAELPTLKELREFVSAVQDIRLPADLPDFEGLADDIASLHARAHAAHVVVIDPDVDHEASAYYRSQEAELLAAGQRSERDEMEAIQKELAAAAAK